MSPSSCWPPPQLASRSWTLDCIAPPQVTMYWQNVNDSKSIWHILTLSDYIWLMPSQENFELIINMRTNLDSRWLTSAGERRSCIEPPGLCTAWPLHQLHDSAAATPSSYPSHRPSPPPRFSTAHGVFWRSLRQGLPRHPHCHTTLSNCSWGTTTWKIHSQRPGRAATSDSQYARAHDQLGLFCQCLLPQMT